MEHYGTYADRKNDVTIAEGLKTFVEETQVNEIIVIANIYDQEARLKSYKLVSEVFDAIEVSV